MDRNSVNIYGSFVWLFSGMALFGYAFLGIFGFNIPGVEELVDYIQSANGVWIYLAAFLSILFEGLYVIGNFFPGATMVLIVAVVSGLKSPVFFLSVILTIFLGWVLAGFINIAVATYYKNHQLVLSVTDSPKIYDRVWLTWFPSFRANYEVAQIAEGGDPKQVFLSSLRVRFWASIAAAINAYTLPFFININEMKNEEGFWSVILVAVISITVGIWKLKSKKDESDSTTSEH